MLGLKFRQVLDLNENSLLHGCRWRRLLHRQLYGLRFGLYGLKLGWHWLRRSWRELQGDKGFPRFWEFDMRPKRCSRRLHLGLDPLASKYGKDGNRTPRLWHRSRRWIRERAFADRWRRALLFDRRFPCGRKRNARIRWSEIFAWMGRLLRNWALFLSLNRLLERLAPVNEMIAQRQLSRRETDW